MCQWCNGSTAGCGPAGESSILSRHSNMQFKTKVECLKFNEWLLREKYIDFKRYQFNIRKIRKMFDVDKSL